MRYEDTNKLFVIIFKLNRLFYFDLCAGWHCPMNALRSL